MPKLPVFFTIGQAMSVFGLHIGKLFKWALIPAILSLAALGAAFGLGLWLQPPGGGGTRFPFWWMGFVPAGLFCIVAWVPYAIRINQLAVTGAAAPGGYLEKIFSRVSFRYLGYAILVAFIGVAGMGISALPVILSGSAATMPTVSPRFVLACAVTLVLMLAFFILTSPLNLIYPAASVERQPSLARAYALGSDCKLRLFLCVVLSALLFAVLGQVVEFAPRVLGLGKTQFVKLAFVPVQIILTFFSYVTSTAIPAVAYRILSGRPDPQAGQEAGPPREEACPVQEAARPGESGPPAPPGGNGTGTTPQAG